MRGTWIIILLIVLAIAACKKDTPNPYDELERGSPNPTVENIPQDNFAWIHQKILRPSCAVSGCHDGNFEPEFRSIGSAYNSLVYHPTIANTPQGSFTYRVVPGDVDGSFLHERLTVFVPNTSGIMPLELTADSDWPANSNAYRAVINNWIASGAKDMFGNTPTPGNLEPQVIGVLAFAAGATNNAFPRGDGEGVQPIEVSGSAIDLWFAFSDDETASNALTYNKVKVATTISEFGTVPELTLITSNSVSGPDLGNTATTFTHKVQLQLGAYSPGTVLFVRVYVDDGAHSAPTEIPNDGTTAPMLNYFTFRIAS
ncbi:MAG: hypothetical protein KA408_04725 [Flavobacteriales bacterium]|nr:hypothetical protein [Flavobacteriales bacterium]